MTTEDPGRHFKVSLCELDFMR